MVKVSQMVEVSSGRASESGHWYDRNGQPCYEVRAANGQMRPATLRDARKFGWVPGVSSICQMEHKPALVRWQIEQALMSALTLPRLEGEDDGAFLARAREDSQQQAKKAAERGTAIHAALQGYFEGQPCAAEYLPFVMPVRDYLAQRFGECEWVAESSFAHPLGYGGKCDLRDLRGLANVDFKCKDFGPEKPARELAWPEHCMQLVAYADGFGTPDATCVNIFVSTRVPGLVVTREWDPQEISENREAFRCLLRLWQLRRGYDSSFQVEQAA